MDAEFVTTIRNKLGRSDLSPLDPNRPPFQERQPMVINLDQLEEDDDYNPRLTNNKEFERIKASIAIRGLDSPIPITQRPGSETFIRKAGGKTRCKALRELLEETGDFERYGKLETIFIPWVSETDLRIGHATENLLRSGLNFYEQAVQERAIFNSICTDDPSFKNASLSDRQSRYENLGLKIDRTYLHTFDYVFEKLHPALETQLLNGMQIRTIKAIRSLESKLSSILLSQDQSASEDFDGIFRRTVLRHGKASSTFDLELFEKELTEEVARRANSTSAELLHKGSTPNQSLPLDNVDTPQTNRSSPTPEPQQSTGQTSQSTLDNSQGRQTVRPSPQKSSPSNHRNKPDNNHQQGSGESVNDLGVETTLNAIREEALGTATKLAISHGLIGGSFYTLNDIGLGYGVESPDHVSLLEQENGVKSVCVFLQMHSIFWAVLAVEIANGRVTKDMVTQRNPETQPESIIASETYRNLPQPEIHFCLDKIRLNAAIDRSHGKTSNDTQTIDGLDKLRSLAERYVQTLVSHT